MLLDPNKRGLTIGVMLERIKPSGSDIKGEVTDAKKEMLSEIAGADEDKMEDAEEGMSEDEECEICCETILDAFQKNDPKALHQALKDYLDLLK